MKKFLILYYPALMDLLSFYPLQKEKQKDQLYIIKEELEGEESALFKKYKKKSEGLIEEKKKWFYTPYNMYNYMKREIYTDESLDRILWFMENYAIENVLIYYRYSTLLKILKRYGCRIFIYDQMNELFMEYHYLNISAYIKQEKRAIENHSRVFKWIEEVKGRLKDKKNRKDIKILYIVVTDNRMYSPTEHIFCEYQKYLEKYENEYLKSDLSVWNQITEGILEEMKPEYIFYSIIKEKNQERTSNEWKILLQNYGKCYHIPNGMGYWERQNLESKLLFLWMVKIIYQEMFQDMDLKTILIDFYKENYGLDLEEQDIKTIIHIDKENKDLEGYM